MVVEPPGIGFTAERIRRALTLATATQVQMSVYTVGMT